MKLQYPTNPQVLNTINNAPTRLRDKIVYVLSTIKTRPLFDKRLKEGNPQRWIPLKAAILQDNIGTRNYKEVMAFCESNQLIEIDRHYKEGSFCRKYRLPDWIRESEWKYYRDAKPVFNRAICKHEKIYLDGQSEIIRDIYDSLCHTTLEEIPESVYQSLNHENRMMVNMFRNEDYFISVDEQGRVYNNVTNLPNRQVQLRKYLRIEGNGLEQLDIHASHPLFAALMIKSLAAETFYDFGRGELVNNWFNDRPIVFSFLFLPFSQIPSSYDMYFLGGELNQWLDLLCRGEFYKFLQKKTGLENIPKGQFKNEIFFRSFYGPIVQNIKDNDVRRVNECLHETFPNMFQILDYAKRRGQQTKTKWITVKGRKCLVNDCDTSHSILARTFQTLEADFMYKTICPAIKEQLGIRYLPLHDAILFPKGNGLRVKELMESCFMEKFGIVPLLKLEDV